MCSACDEDLCRKKVPNLSRSSYPIAAFGVPKGLKQLSEMEKTLISPVLPMLYIYQHQGSIKGQYNSHGQSIALQNNFHEIAQVLPRWRAEIFLKLCTQRGALQNVRPHLIREALEFLKASNHPDLST